MAAALALSGLGTAVAQQTPSPTWSFPPGQWVTFPPDVTETSAGLSTNTENTIICNVAITRGARSAVGNAPHILSGVGFRVATPAAGGLLQWAIYSDVDGYPGVLQITTGDISVATAGIKTAPFKDNRTIGVGGSSPLGDRFWRCFMLNAAAGGVATFYGVTYTLTHLQLVGTSLAGNGFASAVPAYGISCGAANCTGQVSTLTYGVWPVALVISQWGDGLVAGRMPLSVWQIATPLPSTSPDTSNALLVNH